MQIPAGCFLYSLLSGLVLSEEKACAGCGATIAPDASYCHKCGRPVSVQPAVPQQGSDHFRIGLLLIKVGAVLSLFLPFLTLVGVSTFVNTGIFSAAGGLFLGVFIGVIAIGVVFALLAFKCHNDIAAGKKDRTIHAIILGVIMFVGGSNIAGALVGIGAYLCHTSPSNRQSTARSA